jgi:hypothetical protein
VREHAGPGRAVAQRLGDGQASSLGHPDVDERDVGARRLGELDRLGGVARRADQLELVVRGDQVGERSAQDGFVVGDEDPDDPLHVRTLS